MSLLSNVHLSPYTSKTRSWVSSSLGVFLIKSFFSVLSYSPDSVPFYPANFMWNSKVSSKVKAFAWLVALKNVNTNDLLQLRRPFKTLSPDWCILCWSSIETIDHLFLHCLIALGLWQRIFFTSWDGVGFAKHFVI